MKSSRCYGENKFFRQCPHYCVSSKEFAFCWEHEDQENIRLAEIEKQKVQGKFNEWIPIGAFTSNISHEDEQEEIVVNRRSLEVIAADAQNVHTEELQTPIRKAIRKLLQWGVQHRVVTERDLAMSIEYVMRSIPVKSSVQMKALEHLRHCYRWNDNTQMFGTTYPILSSVVWARVQWKNDETLIERFFEEVSESSGLCLNGNMSRLMNCFGGLDSEMSAQSVTTVLSMEQVGHKFNCIRDSVDKERLALSILQESSIPESEWQEWIDNL